MSGQIVTQDASQKPENKRKAISKKVRFEVFKRDSFKCQYCGEGAPEVILHIDHINPVSKGGDNDILNLITACAGCNGGKSDRLLTDTAVMDKQRAQLEELNVRREQLEQMLEWRDELRELDECEVDAAKYEWEAHAIGWHANAAGERTLKKLIAKFGLEDVLDAIGKAAAAYLKYDEEGNATSDSADNAWSKIGGICRMKSQPDWMRELYYIRGILRNRLSYVNERACILLLTDAYEMGAPLDELKDIALWARNWTQFKSAVQEAVEE